MAWRLTKEGWVQEPKTNSELKDSELSKKKAEQTEGEEAEEKPIIKRGKS